VSEETPLLMAVESFSIAGVNWPRTSTVSVTPPTAIVAFTGRLEAQLDLHLAVTVAMPESSKVSV